MVFNYFISFKKKTPKFLSQNAFKRSREAAIAANARHAGFEVAPLVLRELAPIRDRPMAAFRRADTNSVVNKCPVIPLEHLESTPAMQYWTHTEVNINVRNYLMIGPSSFQNQARCIFVINKGDGPIS